MVEVVEQEIDMVPVSDLRVHPENPNEGDIPRIRESIRERGFYGALIVQRSTGKILAGNHRFKAATLEGLKELPVLWLNVGDEEALKILEVDNNTAQAASVDKDKERSILESLSDLSGIGLTEDEIYEILHAEDDFEVEEWEAEDLEVTSEMAVVSPLKLQPEIRELLLEEFGDDIEVNEFLSVDIEEATTEEG